MYKWKLKFEKYLLVGNIALYIHYNNELINNPECTRKDEQINSYEVML